MQLDIERRLAISELLAQPDPPEMRRRAHRRTLPGKPERYDLVPLLSAAFVQRKLLALHERAFEREIAATHIEVVALAPRTLPGVHAVAA
jgi:BarA-like signal transduction histidine kinase